MPGKVWISWKIGRSCTPLREFLGRGRKVDPINSLNGLVCKYGFVIIHLQTYNMYMMITSSANRVQTGFRLEPIVLARVKEAARQQNISANEFVNRTLKEATQSIESEQEREECRKHTEAFLDAAFGSWVGDESEEEILNAGKSMKTVREVLPL